MAQIWRFSHGGVDYELRATGAPRADGREIVGHRTRLVRLFASDPTLRSLLRSVARGLDPRDLSLDHAGGVLARAFERGALRLFALERGDAMVAEQRGERQVSSAPSAGEELTWIEIQLVDEADQLVSGVAYSIELSNGRIQRGVTTAGGVIRYQDIPSGECRLSFDLDRDAWEAA